MTKFICMLIGHREFSDEVRTIRPWEDPDFAGYSLADFREAHCLRCGDALASAAVAAAGATAITTEAVPAAEAA